MDHWAHPRWYSKGDGDISAVITTVTIKICVDAVIDTDADVTGSFGCQSSCRSRDLTVWQPAGKWEGYPLGACGWTAGLEAVSAYLIRSRPSGRKTNSRACYYCRARGRAVTRAQHNIYTAGLTHIHRHTHTLNTCQHIYLHTFRDVYKYTQETGARMKTIFEKHNFSWTNNRLSVDFLLMYTSVHFSLFSGHANIHV